jgi:hypothetical protein
MSSMAAVRLGEAHGDDDALAGGEAVGLDDDRCALDRRRRRVPRSIGERLEIHAVGMLCRAMKRLAKSFELSSWAASFVGPKIFRPRRGRR